MDVEGVVGTQKAEEKNTELAQSAKARDTEFN